MCDDGLLIQKAFVRPASGIECMIIASVPTINGGSMNEASALKGGRLGQIVAENRLPVINLTQSVSELRHCHIL